jgi:hypothetical protein
VLSNLILYCSGNQEGSIKILPMLDFIWYRHFMQIICVNQFYCVVKWEYVWLVGSWLSSAKSLTMLICVLQYMYFRVHIILLVLLVMESKSCWNWVVYNHKDDGWTDSQFGDVYMVSLFCILHTMLEYNCVCWYVTT